MKLVKPNRLKKGDLIGIISPASSPDDLTRIEKGVQYLESLGYKTEVGKNVGKYYGYLAGTNEERLEDLHYMFGKKEVKAVICVRGGYGSPRLLPHINFNLIKKNPKIFVGYSDITSLQMAFLKKANLVTFAGPMLAVDLYNEVNPYAEEYFWRALTSPKKIGKIRMPENEELKIIHQGKAEGPIIGGNLTLFASLFGTGLLPKAKNSILLLEDIGEVAYRVDRYLVQFVLAGIFEKINGLVLGHFTDCEETDPTKKTLTLDEVLDGYLNNLMIPTVSNFSHGHIKNIVTIPFGINVKLNADKGFIELTEGAVE